MSAIRRFRVDVDPPFGMGESFIHRLLDTAEAKLLEQFDAWRASEQPTVLACDFGRVISFEISRPTYAWLAVLYDRNSQ